MSYRQVQECRLCDADTLTDEIDFGMTPLANELDGTDTFPLLLKSCRNCGHHQLSIAVAPERLWGPNYPYQSGTSPVFREHLADLADHVAALKPGGRVLEIASNDGTLVDMLRERKLSAFGIDPSGPWDTSRGLLTGSWPSSTSAMLGKDFDCILALNVMAHVDGLALFTMSMKSALAPDGVFIFEVGDFEQVCRKGAFDTIYHEHMSYHDVGSLTPFFARHGLDLFAVERNDSQGGSIRGYVKHA